MFKLRLRFGRLTTSRFTRKVPPLAEPPPAPPPVRCPKPLELVLFCQWRSGYYCTDRTKYDLCIGVWEKGFSR